MSETKRFKKGDVIIHEGSSGSFAYIISSGSVEVSKKVGDEKFVLSTLGTGSIIGEMSLIDGKPRSATVTALEETVVKPISRKQLESMLERNPRALFPLLRQVFQRLRYLNQVVTAFCGRTETGLEGTKARTPLKLKALSREAERALTAAAIEITKIPFQIGRTTSDSIFGASDLELIDSEPYQISRCHCLLTMVDEQYYLVDTVSSSGTVVDGVRIGGREEKKRALLARGKHQLILGGEHSPYAFELEVP